MTQACSMDILWQAAMLCSFHGHRTYKYQMSFSWIFLLLELFWAHDSIQSTFWSRTTRWPWKNTFPFSFFFFWKKKKKEKKQFPAIMVALLYSVHLNKRDVICICLIWLTWRILSNFPSVASKSWYTETVWCKLGRLAVMKVKASSPVIFLDLLALVCQHLHQGSAIRHPPNPLPRDLVYFALWLYFGRLLLCRSQSELK